MSYSIPTVIAIDWGSSNFRAYLLDQRYKILDCIKHNEGIKQQQNQDHAAILKRLLQSWQTKIDEHQVPIIMAGMIGSNLGWYEAPYLACPLPLSSLAQHLYTFISPWDTNAYIVPGVKVDDQQNADVMRAEEILILGAQQLSDTAIYCLPGTHSKWATLNGNSLATFVTLMTGELYAVLLQHTLLGLDLPKQQYDEEWFNNGVLSAQEQGEVITQLFQVRARRLLKQLPVNVAASYLSGLLIGNEINTMLAHIDNPDKIVTMVATSQQLSESYQQVFTLLNTPVKIVDGESAFLQGIRVIMRELK